MFSGSLRSRVFFGTIAFLSLTMAASAQSDKPISVVGQIASTRLMLVTRPRPTSEQPGRVHCTGQEAGQR